MTGTKRLIGRMFVCAGLLCTGTPPAMACEKTEPKCIAVNALLSKMEVREKLLEAQRTCRNGAANRAPGVLAERGVFRAGGAIERAANFTAIPSLLNLKKKAA